MGQNVTIGNLHIKPTVNGLGEALTVSNTVAQLDSTKWGDNVRYVAVQVQDQPVRVTYNGVDPTTTVGFRYEANRVIEMAVQAAIAARFLREGGTDATVYAEGFTD